jgi:ribonucleotide monophosphatase NagD (HAD superfamily)
VGIDSIGGEDEEGFYERNITIEDFDKIEIDPEVKAVVVGLDQRFTYAKLCLASLYISHGAKYICTNDDSYDMVQGRKMPGAGPIVESIQITLNMEGGSQEVRRPENVGKPNPYVIELIQRENNIADRSKYAYLVY